VTSERDEIQIPAHFKNSALLKLKKDSSNLGSTVKKFHVNKSLLSKLATVCSVDLTMYSQITTFVFLSVLYVILLIFFVNSLLKQQSTQLPAMKAVISQVNF
jgi:hypothetical protein